MALTKVTYSMIQDAPVNVVDYGADPTGVADSTAAIQAAIDADIGNVFLPPGIYRTTAPITITGSAPSIYGVGKRYNTGVKSQILIDHAGTGFQIITQAQIGTVVSGISFVRSSGYVGQGINVLLDGATGTSIVSQINIEKCYIAGGATGLRLRGVISSTFNSIVVQGQATAGIDFYGTGITSPGCNLNDFTDINVYNITSGTGIKFEGTDCGRSNSFNNVSVENCGTPIEISSGNITQNLQFNNLWIELCTNPMNLRGGSHIYFNNLRYAQTGVSLVNSSTYGATDVYVNGMYGASATTSIGTAGISVNDYVRTTNAPSYSASNLTESSYQGTQLAQSISATQVSGESVVGAVEQSGIILNNALVNWNIGGSTAWVKPSGVTAATDPLGTNTAWSINASQTIYGSIQAGSVDDGSVGKPIELVVWVKGTGTVRLQNRGDGFAVNHEYDVDSKDWVRLTMRYLVSDTTNRTTQMFMIFTLPSANSMSVWRPGIYNGFSTIDSRPYAISGGFEGGWIDSAYTFGKRDASAIIVYGTAAPTSVSYAWAVGDRVINTTPTSGGYIGWVCTTAGSPGTWKGYGAIA